MARINVWLLLVVALGLLGGFVVGHQALAPDVVSEVATQVVVDTAQEQLITQYYAPLIPFTIGTTTIQVSVADTRETRIKGLSDTPVLPVGLGKLFVFESDSDWSIWMKDMQYPLDIIWLDGERVIVHIEENVSPATYPESFSSPTPARYVLEVNASTTAEYGWSVGDQAAW